MNVLNRVREARARLKARGVSEHQNAEVLEDLFARAQELIAQMNVAKVKAIRDAEAPFLEELEAIDKEMAMFVALVA